PAPDGEPVLQQRRPQDHEGRDRYGRPDDDPPLPGPQDEPRQAVVAEVLVAEADHRGEEEHQDDLRGRDRDRREAAVPNQAEGRDGADDEGVADGHPAHVPRIADGLSRSPAPPPRRPGARSLRSARPGSSDSGDSAGPSATARRARSGTGAW